MGRLGLGLSVSVSVCRFVLFPTTTELTEAIKTGFAKLHSTLKRFNDVKDVLQKLAAARPELTDFLAKLMDDPIGDQNHAKLEDGGKTLGNLMAAQSLFKPLKAGETHKMMCKRCLRGFAKKSRPRTPWSDLSAMGGGRGWIQVD